MKRQPILFIAICLALAALIFPGMPGSPASGETPQSCSYNTSVEEIVDEIDEAQWLDFLKDISGVKTVNINDTRARIATRYSYNLFTNPNARAFEYLVQKLHEMHYTDSAIEEDPYRWCPSTCYDWKNLVLTIPGQTPGGGQVLLTAHMDSTSNKPTSEAPGAEDNGSGTVSLLEAARLLRHYQFHQTIKLIWFTGEEQGLVGSEFYVQDHQTSNILGVVNLDMFGYDADQDRCFEMHVGTLAASDSVGQCFAASIDAYGLGLTYDFLTTQALGASDHSTFWDVGVGAIEILENYGAHSLPGGCTGRDRNPYYHTIGDTYEKVYLPAAVNIARAGVATVAGMAEPLGACFTEAPELTGSATIDQVNLVWETLTGADTFRLYRYESDGCQGNALQVASDLVHLTYIDHSALPGVTYTYQVEAVAPDGQCISRISGCTAALSLPANLMFLPVASKAD